MIYIHEKFNYILLFLFKKINVQLNNKMNNLIICLLLTISSVKSDIRQKRECKQPLTTVSGPASHQGFCAGDLVFEDNFDWLDLNKWQHEISLWGGGNNEFQWYANNRNNTFTSNGNLFIKPTLTSDFLGGQNKLYSATVDLGASCTVSDNNGCKRTGTSENVLNPIRSGRLHTLHSFAFKYGKVEIRAKMPAGDWLWPSLWFMPHDSKYGAWPRSGEIDLAECRSNRDLQLGGKNIGIDSTGSTLHWGPDYKHNTFKPTHYELYKPGHGFNTEFRNYELMWTPDFIRFSINGEVLGTADPGSSFWNFGEFAKQGIQDNPWKGRGKMAPFDQEFFIILNLAVGGTSGYFPDNAKNYPKPKPWKNSAPHAMTDFWKAKNDWLPTWKLWENNGYDVSFKIDYVRIWAI